MSIMRDPGEIRDRIHVAQVRNFGGLRWGSISPTDIDGFLDFGNKLFVFIETKYRESVVPLGQKKALERLCKAGCDSGIPGYVLIASHSDVGDVRVATAIVMECFNGVRWKGGREAKTVREVIDSLLQKHRIEI
jgi:hypothetical protein